MTRDQAVWLAVGGLALLCLILLVVVLRLRAGAARSRAQVEALRERLERLETQVADGRSRSSRPLRARPAAQTGGDRSSS